MKKVALKIIVVVTGCLSIVLFSDTAKADPSEELVTACYNEFVECIHERAPDDCLDILYLCSHPLNVRDLIGNLVGSDYSDILSVPAPLESDDVIRGSQGTDHLYVAEHPRSGDVIIVRSFTCLDEVAQCYCDTDRDEVECHRLQRNCQIEENKKADRIRSISGISRHSKTPAVSFGDRLHEAIDNMCGSEEDSGINIGAIQVTTPAKNLLDSYRLHNRTVHRP